VGLCCFVFNVKGIQMKLIRVKRQTRVEKRFSPKMGKLYTNVTYIKKEFLTIPVKTLHKYRQTYYGEIKDCEECLLSR
jgi:hypothetical protein